MHEADSGSAPMPPRLQVALVCADLELRGVITAACGTDSKDWIFFNSGREAVGSLLVAPPDCIICAAELPDMSGLHLAVLFKEENVYSQVPFIICFTAEQAMAVTDWTSFVADDFFIFPAPSFLVKARLEMILIRATRALDANPLTYLPGNTSIIRYTHSLIDARRDFALAYCDLDYFKSFNDKYGLSRGDEVLRMTARVILNSVKLLRPPFCFVGHVGGDDFIFIVPVDMAEETCRAILNMFDAIVPQFYDEEDCKRCGIVSTDRQGIPRFFPIMTLSIVVICNRNGSIKHYGEASQQAMDLKSKVKENPLSSYIIDRRGLPPQESVPHDNT